jgi:hypothetical protein
MFGRHPAMSDPVREWRPATDPEVPSRACCCPARPVVKVVIPPVPGRPHPVDLWLCGHHYRASRAALLLAGASVEDLNDPRGADIEILETAEVA